MYLYLPSDCILLKYLSIDSNCICAWLPSITKSYTSYKVRLTMFFLTGVIRFMQMADTIDKNPYAKFIQTRSMFTDMPNDMQYYAHVPLATVVLDSNIVENSIW